MNRQVKFLHRAWLTQDRRPAGVTGNRMRIFILRSHLRCSYESGVAQIVDQDLVDEAVLSEGLDHHHPLGTELQQDFGDVQRLERCSASQSTPIPVVVVVVVVWGGNYQLLVL